jgi:aminoglycoside phosphotransferase (APT) family kinase protein
MSALGNELKLAWTASQRLARTARDSGERSTLTALASLLGELAADADVDRTCRLDATGEAELLRRTQALITTGADQRPDGDGQDDHIDPEALRSFLIAALPGEQAIEVIESHTVSRGMSKKTVLVALRNGRELPDRVALRIDRSANNYLGTTVIDEYPIVRLLWDHGARIPQPHALEPTGAVLGDPFILFSAAPGIPVGGNYVPPARDPALIADVARCMAAVHAIPVKDWPLADQPRGPAFFDREYEDYFDDWRALGEHSAIIDAAFDRIQEQRDQAYGPAALIHNDFNFNNMLVENGCVTAVLDWEFAHVGTPASDLAYFRYSADAGSSFAAFLQAYAEAGGTIPPPGQLEFYTLWGQLRLAVMGFKAVRQFEDGRFDDIRFGSAIGYRRQGILRVADLLGL